MELYRKVHGPHPGCNSHALLQDILATGEPEVDVENPRIVDLLDREQILFYPKSKIKSLLGDATAIKSILGCRCETCRKHLEMSDSDRDEIISAILNPKRPKILLLAILVYLGRGYMIRQLSRRDGIDDSALDLTPQRLNESTWAKLFDTPVVDGSISPEGVQKMNAFLENYGFAVDLFNAPVFSTLKPWTHEYSKGRRFPYLNDQPHSRGSFGEVRKFNIHPDYLEVDEAVEQKERLREAKKVGYSVNVTQEDPDWETASVC